MKKERVNAPSPTDGGSSNEAIDVADLYRIGK